MEWLLDNYLGLLIAITLFMIYAKLDEVQMALKQTKYIFSEQSKVDQDRYYACFNPVLEDLIKTAQQ